MLLGLDEFAPAAPVELCAPLVAIEPWLEAPMELFGEAVELLLGDCVVIVLLAAPFGVCVVVVVVVVLCVPPTLEPVCEVPDDVAVEGLV